MADSERQVGRQVDVSNDVLRRFVLLRPTRTLIGHDDDDDNYLPALSRSGEV